MNTESKQSQFVSENTNSSQSSELIKRERHKGFIIVTTEEGSRITIGSHVISEFLTFNECVLRIDTKDWDLLHNTMIACATMITREEVGKMLMNATENKQ